MIAWFCSTFSDEYLSAIGFKNGEVQKNHLSAVVRELVLGSFSGWDLAIWRAQPPNLMAEGSKVVRFEGSKVRRFKGSEVQI